MNNRNTQSQYVENLENQIISQCELNIIPQGYDGNFTFSNPTNNILTIEPPSLRRWHASPSLNVGFFFGLLLLQFLNFEEVPLLFVYFEFYHYNFGTCRIAYPASPSGVCPAVDLQVKRGFRSQESDGYVMTQGFRQVRAAQKRNTLRPYELDDDDLKHFLWIPSRPLYSPGAMGYK